MGKRFTRGVDALSAPHKRQKIVHEAPTAEDIYASRQLRHLLSYDQDLARTRHGLQSFKLFLDALLAKQGDHEEHVKILKDYLDAVRPTDGVGASPGDGDGDSDRAVYLPDIMQTWSQAAQTNNDNIMSAVAVILALLLKLLSHTLDMAPCGLGICRTLLQKRQLELISRNLSADKGKSFIISPTLRMLREVVCFDGGAVASPLFRARASTLKSLARNMGIGHIGDVAEDIKRPSVRTNAVQFFLSALRYMHPEAKKELLSQRDIVAALTRDFKQDPPYLVSEILGGLRSQILLDDKLAREAKSNLLNVSTLVRISSLYQYRQTTSEESGSTSPSIPDVAHDFLMTACTTPSCGVLRQDSGLYPREIDPNAVIPVAELDELGLEAVVWMNRFKTEVPVRNYVLSNFLQNLRPWSSIQQSELVTAVFRVAPELVANFFLNNKSFSFEPKLSATWIGYAAFLFNTVAMPLPECFCRAPVFPELPPPTSLVLDNILPLPLNQKALVRCLAHKSNIISFFATRILVLAIQKLDTALKLHHDPSHPSPLLWREAARRLVDEFCQRSPGIKDMINSYRLIPEDDILHREAASQLLRLCYEVIPQIALTAKFDVSPFLETALVRLSKQDESDDPRDFALSLKELENLLAIAGYSPGMRWFTASDSLALSPFAMLLKVYVDAPRRVSLDKARQVLGFVAVEHQLVPAHTGRPGLLPLLETLQSLNRSSPDLMAQVWPFLDNCLTRCATSPIKYLEIAQELIQEASASPGNDDSPRAAITLVTVAMLEQLLFATKTENKLTLGALAQFLPRYMGFSAAGGEDRPLLDAIYSKMLPHLPKGKGTRAPKAIPDGVTFEYNTWPLGEETSQSVTKITGTIEDKTSEVVVMSAEDLQRALGVPDGLTPDNSALVKWTQKTADELVDEGYAVSLMTLLVSEHASIRKEALVNILKMAAKVRQSEYEEKEQIWLLLSELAETAREFIEEGPLPSPTVAFACHALAVLRDPLSTLYPKVNLVLTRGPVWNLDKVPLADEILLEEPSVGDSYYSQINWLLSYLVDSLRTPRDLELFHKKRLRGPLLERLLALASNPYMRLPLKTQVLRVLYRATGIEGGSTTLTTRFGVVSWLEAQSARCTNPSEAALYRAMLARIWETCDQDKVSAWSRHGVKASFPSSS
ncbi:ribosome 60S biogenesis N-terminal-domain-containing protein [Lasiosphaeria ovina]|uniref:Ribosome 60S biogenesis N-terminal-domain-containing protein n=1 Tax=Lasiosphaeria ovina TaxID=92902 RepID=A0AAE0NEJ0_9PEZI|nr:ribosome 60S biogenesis N-terminal-domain-containing protein [Lasiosphaeria ovina]